MDTNSVINKIVDWLINYNNKAKTKGFVVGISGGVDSAVVSCLCAKTNIKTLCVQMPIYQDKSQVNRAKKHIEKLKQNYSNVDEIEIDLTSVFDTFVSKVPNDTNNDLPLANTRARLRMTTLYYFAGLNNMLVVGTGNKIEDFGVGFFTKYGDGGVDISPIADLLKSEVYLLAKELNVIEDIVKAPPTDGLFGDERTDKDQLGATYDELEWAMAQTDKGKTPQDFKAREKEVMHIYQKLNKANQHKMKLPEVCKIHNNLK